MIAVSPSLLLLIASADPCSLTCLGAIGLADRNIASGLIIGCFPSFPTYDLGLIWVRLYSVLIDFALLVLP